MVYPVLLSQTKTRRIYRFRIYQIVAAIVFYLVEIEKTPIMVEPDVFYPEIGRETVFPKPIYRCHFVQNRVLRRNIVSGIVEKQIFTRPFICAQT